MNGLKLVMFHCFLMVSAGSKQSKHAKSDDDGKGLQVRIINGEDASHEDYPFLVSIQIYLGMSDWSSTCGGSIVNRETVLTACHCVTSDEQIHGNVKNMAEPESLRVVAGTAFWDESAPSKQVRGVRSLITHPQCKNFFQFDMSFVNDVALVLLKKQLDYNYEVQPMPLPSRDIPEALTILDRFINTGTWCSTVGWGRTVESSPTQSKTLKSARVQLLTYTECRERLCKTTHSHCKVDFESLGQICVASPISSDCYGDSGGPLVCHGVVVGTVSYGDRCWANLPTIFQGLRPILELLAIKHIKIDEPNNVSIADPLGSDLWYFPTIFRKILKINS